ncbi:unnamed protein product, partial [Rotaria sp. Silwood2]
MAECEKKLNETKQTIVTLCDLIMKNPYEEISNLKESLELFRDIVPGYRIRSLKEQTKDENDEIKKITRKFYQKMLSLLDNHLTKNKHKQIKTIEPSKLNLGYLAIQCLCKLLTYLHHFNFRRNLHNVVIQYTTSSIIRAQSASPHNTRVYACLVSVINAFINIVGDYISKKTIISFCRSYEDNDKAICFSTIKFIAHLINQNVLHEFTAFEILIFLLKNPSDDDVELAIEFVKECGQKLSQVNPQDQFKENPSIAPGLNLADKNNQYTHMITFHTFETKPLFEVFNYDKKYEEHEEQYNVIKEMFFHKSGDDENKSNSSINNDKGDRKNADVDEEKKKQETVIDEKETNLPEIRINLYKMIRENNEPQDCAKKLLELHLRPAQEAFRGIRFTELKTTSSRGVYIKNLFCHEMDAIEMKKYLKECYGPREGRREYDKYEEEDQIPD